MAPKPELSEAKPWGFSAIRIFQLAQKWTELDRNQDKSERWGKKEPLEAGLELAQNLQHIREASAPQEAAGDAQDMCMYFFFLHNSPVIDHLDYFGAKVEIFLS